MVKLSPDDPDYHCRSGSEHGEQTALFCWVANEIRASTPLGAKLDMLFAVPNGGDRAASVGAMLKAEGVRRGVPDLCLPIPQFLGLSALPRYHALFIEMKRANGSISDVFEEQKEWHKKLVSNGNAVAVCFGWRPAKEVLIDYLTGKKIIYDNA